MNLIYSPLLMKSFMHGVHVTPPLHVDHEFLVPHNRRGHGGVAILWRKTLSDVHKLTEFASHQHIGFSVCNRLKIFSTYLSTISGRTNIYKKALDHLNVIRKKYSDNGILIFAGDMNADIGTSDGPLATTTINEQGRILSHYLKAWNFVSAHLYLNTEDTSHTYESESNTCISTIDHFLCPQHCLPSFSKCSTLSNLTTATNTSDYVPLVAEVAVPVQVSQPPPIHRRGSTPNWKKLSEEEIRTTYTQLLESKLSTLSSPNLDTCRENPRCLDKYLQALCEAMLSSSQETIPTKKYHKHRKPNSNPSLNAAHRRAKNAWYYWKRASKPTDPLHPAKSQYKKGKREFRKKYYVKLLGSRSLIFSGTLTCMPPTQKNSSVS